MRAKLTSLLVLTFFGIPLLAGTLGGCARATEGERLLVRSAAYLWQAQEADGGWHSAMHGIARSGQSWSAFTLYHLLATPPTHVRLPRSSARRAFDFLEAHMDTSSPQRAALGLAGGNTPDYPLYATAYALRAFLIGRDRGLLTSRQEALIPAMAAYILDQQYREETGVSPGDPAYGGWGMGGRLVAATLPPRLRSPYADVAHTRRALEALADVSSHSPSLRARTDSARSAAHVFLARVQKRGLPTYDGGFYYSPAVPELNKAGLLEDSGGAEGVPRSYATATSDGLIALISAGGEADDEPVRSAAAYLAAHDTLHHAAGLPEVRSTWRAALFYYHLAGRAEVHVRLESPGPWRERVMALLQERQRPDGSFVNPYGAPNREDDPIIATTLALAAAGAAHR